MTYQPEFGDYKYGPFGPYKNVKAVGWLSKEYEFTKGVTDLKIIEILKKKKLKNLCRGYHRCEFCPSEIINDYNNSIKVGALGNGEIWIKVNEELSYAMPAMVIHYIIAHGYKLPLDVENAILSSKKWLFS